MFSALAFPAATFSTEHQAKCATNLMQPIDHGIMGVSAKWVHATAMCVILSHSELFLQLLLDHWQLLFGLAR
eukprot:4713589-Amphidinium_carterae.1